MLNQANQYIFNIYHYLLNLRDTMEYTIDREHTTALYNQRKEVLTKGISEGSALGNFFTNNKESGDKIKAKIEEFINEIYSSDSNVLMISEDKVRVDHTQHIKIFDSVIGLQESIRDILYGYLNFAKTQNQLDEGMAKLVALDERLTRGIICMLVLKDFEKSFGEFQKAMQESQGKPSPQTNFIVQNEIVKMAGFLRFSRQHAHCTDNETLDLLDDVLKVVEMTEGRRDRPNNRSFKDIFEEINKKVTEFVAKVEPDWKNAYQKQFEEMMKTIKENQAQSETAKA